MADYLWLRRPMRLFLGSLFTVTVYFSAYFSWFSTIVLICLSIVTRLSLTSLFIFLMIPFLIAIKLKSSYDFSKYVKGIRYGLDQTLLILAYFPLIWTVASHYFITSASFAFLASVVWFLFIRFLLRERYDGFSNKQLCFGLIITFAYFMICQKVYDRIIYLSSMTTENEFTPCPTGIILMSVSE